jgi:hypothetical protein
MRQQGEYHVQKAKKRRKLLLEFASPVVIFNQLLGDFVRYVSAGAAELATLALLGG